MKTTLYYIIRFITWLIVTTSAISIIITPIINWIPVFSHIVIFIYSIFVIFIITYIWDWFIEEMKK